MCRLSLRSEAACPDAGLGVVALQPSELRYFTPVWFPVQPSMLAKPLFLQVVSSVDSSKISLKAFWITKCRKVRFKSSMTFDIDVKINRCEILLYLVIINTDM